MAPLKNLTEVKIDSRPDCQIHALAGSTVEAEYDARTTMGSWAYLCEPCFYVYGVGLGTGKGQRLVLISTHSVSGS